MAEPATRFCSALIQPLNFWDVCHQVIGEDATKLYKITDFASTILKTAELLTPLQSTTTATFHSSCTTIKYAGKLVQANRLAWSYFNPRAVPKAVSDYSKSRSTLTKAIEAVSPIFFPKADSKCYSAKTDGFDGHWYTTPLYVIKVSALTTGATLQTYIIGQKILFPQLFSRVGTQFVQTVGVAAAKIGGQNLAIFAKTATNVGASTVKNYCFLIFLVFESYQGWQRFSSSTDSTATHVDLGLKFAANFGKVVVLASLTIFNAPFAVVIGVSLVVCWVDVSGTYQKSLMDAKKKSNLITKNETQAEQIETLEARITELTPTPDGGGDDL